jgi:dUTP pyrophosphatase
MSDHFVDAGKYLFSNSCLSPNPKIACQVTDSRSLPKRAHRTDAGADLFSIADLTIRPGEDGMIDTGLAMKIPVGYGGFVLNRSSQRMNQITSLGAGLIDSDYRGNIRVFLYNGGKEEYKIKAFETKIAQLVIIPVMLCDFYDSWNDTVRGTGGFGSTGK